MMDLERYADVMTDAELLLLDAVGGPPLPPKIVRRIEMARQVAALWRQERECARWLAGAERTRLAGVGAEAA